SRRSAAISSRCTDTPGERTTTSQAPSSMTASAAPATCTAAPPSSSSSPAGGGPSNTAATIRAPGSRRLSCAANEPTSPPAPQTPTRAPSSAEKRMHVADQRTGHVVLVAEGEDGGGVTGVAVLAREHLVDEARHDAMRAPALVGGEQPHRGEALALLADALERLVAARG